MAVAIVSLEDQERLIFEKSLDCLSLIQKEQGSQEVGCPRVWDGVLCWASTPNGTVAEQSCPDYINGFKVEANASRLCTSAGEWWVHPILNDTWTNLTMCSPDKDMGETYDIPELIAAHMKSLRLMKNIGYGISLASLTVAVFLMLYFKRLHCPRNMIHIHLFISFILRATISFVIENALVHGVGFPSDVRVTEDNTIEFLDTGSHWGCKLLFTIFNYILGANYMWIFAEGIYLHMLITVAMFSEKSGVKKLIIFGWGAPVLFVGPWVIVRATLENVLCWNTHPTAGYFWMIRGPICAAMVINFFIFLNIIRVLFTKLNAFNAPDAKRFRLRKLAKSTLVLIPLFGVHYIVFIGLPAKVDQTIELVKLYYEMFFNSFQGFLVSLLFCFFNGEVQAEFKKKWRRYMLKRQGSGFGRRHTMTSFVSRGSVNNHNNCIDIDTINGNGHCLIDRTDSAEKSEMTKSKTSLEHEQRTGAHITAENRHELYPMISSSNHDGNYETSFSEPMLQANTCHSDHIT